MDIIQPKKIVTRRTTNPNKNEVINSAEIGKLWATYMGNSMSKYVLMYYLQHVDDEEIKGILENALNLSEDFLNTINEILVNDKHPVPFGFNEEDVNLDAPRLFFDEFYLHYLKYAAKAGLGLYAIAIPLMNRIDIRDFFTYVLESTVKLLNQVNDLLVSKGYLSKIPNIPIQDRVDFVKKQNYLSGFLGNVRPLHALEIAHLYDNIENSVTSKTLIIGFGQVTKSEKLRGYLWKGKDMTANHIDLFSQKLTKDDLPAVPLLDTLVTTSTFSPFSDKLMLFHKIDMFSTRFSSYGNSMAVNGRHDIGAMYGKFMLEVGMFVNEGAQLMIENGWFEQPPKAADRNDITAT